ncbi:MAG: 4Fe-4S binding protein [Bryobacteraceae bacterium]|nr:4Fe-4S binding protein [Solibacteraceae bacterium]MCL4844319.1 4Fe-4S binding protein [Bryobacteraceae bacterium]MCO5353709.1 4Fe-4S binding protein [Bryobacteraceae bacterium]
MTAAPPPVDRSENRKYERRLETDRSQTWRRAFQAAFFALNVWIGVQFYLFVKHFEGGGWGRFERPPGVEGWLPIASLMNLKFWVLTGMVPGVHPAGMFLLIAFLVMSWVFRKSFCSWLCPVGTFSEYLWKLGRETFRRNWALPKWLDIPLRSLKYILLGLFGYAVYSMSPRAIQEFLESPYGVVADVKMLDFFRKMGMATAVTLAVLVVLSVFVRNFWCRYLCPYGALMGLASMLSPLRIRRDPVKCIDCAKCAKACPSVLPVDQLVQIRSAECIGCLECVAVCPAEGALAMKTAGPKRWAVAPWVMAAGVAGVFFGIVLAAQVSGHWGTQVPDEVYREFIPRAQEFGHP